MPFGNRKFYFGGYIKLIIVTIKKISFPRNLKFYNLGIFKRLKLRILVEKLLPVSLKLNVFQILWAFMGLVNSGYMLCASLCAYIRTKNAFVWGDLNARNQPNAFSYGET